MLATAILAVPVAAVKQRLHGSLSKDIFSLLNMGKGGNFKVLTYTAKTTSQPSRPMGKSYMSRWVNATYSIVQVGGHVPWVGMMEYGQMGTVEYESPCCLGLLGRKSYRRTSSFQEQLAISCHVPH